MPSLKLGPTWDCIPFLDGKQRTKVYLVENGEIAYPNDEVSVVTFPNCLRPFMKMHREYREEESVCSEYGYAYGYGRIGRNLK